MENEFKNISPVPRITIIDSAINPVDFLSTYDVIRQRPHYKLGQPFIYNKTWSYYNTDNMAREIKYSNYSIIKIHQISNFEIRRVYNSLKKKRLLSALMPIMQHQSQVTECIDDVWSFNDEAYFFLVHENLQPHVFDTINKSLSRIKPRIHNVFINSEDDTDNNVLEYAFKMYKGLKNVNVLHTGYRIFIGNNGKTDLYQFSSKDQALQFKLTV